MGFSHFHTIHIKGIAACVPKHIEKIMDFPYLFSEKEKKRFIKNIGIKERRIADKDVCASDLGYKAAEELIQQLKIDPKTISALVFLSQTPDFIIPFTSNILQDRLGLSNACTCLDINAGCSGFITGMQTIYSLCQSFSKGKILFIIAETMSKILSLKDRSTSLLFGDAAAALIIEKSPNQKESFFSNFSHGQHYKAVNIPHGGFRNPATPDSHVQETFADGSTRSRLQLSMDGQTVFDFTMDKIAPCVLDMHGLINVPIEKIDYFIFHQSNLFIIKQLARKLKIPMKKILVNIEQFGNTSGVSIPLAMVTELPGTATKKTMLHCCGYGSGLSWGSAVLDIKDTKIIPLMEY